MGRRQTTAPCHFCGEATKKGTPCRIRVPFQGVKCRFHADPAEGFQCAICLEDGAGDDGAYRLRCGHWYHEACLHRWCTTSMTCPTCRRPVRDAKTVEWVETFATADEEWLPEEEIDDVPMRVLRTRARRRQAALRAHRSMLEQILDILLPQTLQGWSTV